MTIDDIWKKHHTFLKFSDYEVDFLLDEPQLSQVNNDVALLDFLSSFEYQKPQIVENLKVTANIATQPSRFEFLLEMLKSIEGQFDEIRIYLNNFREIPHQLREYNCQLGKDLTDNGKFFWSENEGEYYFTLDDDIIYPPDYVEKTIPLIKDRIVTYHGRNLFGLNQPYYNNHKVYSFHNALKSEVKLDVGGTGVMAFNTNIFKPTIWKSPNQKMTDLIISLEATMYGIELVCLPRKINWLKPIEYLNEGIYTEFMLTDNKQTSIADMILTYKSGSLKLDKSMMAISPDRKSVEIIYQKINENLQSEDDFSFYHLGCTSGRMIYHLSLISKFRNLVGLETVGERLDVCNSTIKQSSDPTKIHFIEIEYDKLKFDTQSVIFINDKVMKSSVVEEIWNSLFDGVHFISTKILNHTPVSKFQIVSENGIELTYYYYIKVGEIQQVEFPYQKTFIINLEKSEDRWNRLQKKLKHFNNPERFVATKGREDDYKKYVSELWDWGEFKRSGSEFIKLSDGEVGCIMSHLRIWKKIVFEDIDCCLVVEDDASKIIPGFELILSDLIYKLPDDWDVLLIGFCLFRDKGEMIGEFTKIREFVLTHCYLINKKGASKFLQNIPVNAPIDTWMSNMSDKVNIYSHNIFKKKNKNRFNSALISQYSFSKNIVNTNKIP